MERYAVAVDRAEAMAAFRVVYRELHPSLLRHLRRHAQDDALAADLLQHTFLKIVEARGQFLAGARVRPWAFRIAKNALIDQARREQRRPRAERHPADPDDEPAMTSTQDRRYQDRETLRRVSAVLAKLSGPTREAFELARIDGLPQIEVAEVLGMSESAVKAAVHRASEAIRAELGDEGLA